MPRRQTECCRVCGGKQAEAVEGAASYIQQLQAAFLAAGSAAAGSKKEAANPIAARSALVEQLCGAARLPAADAAAKSAVRRFLAVHAIFTITPGAAGKVRCTWTSLAGPA